MGGGVWSEKRVMEKGEKTGSSEKRGTLRCKNRKRGEGYPNLIQSDTLLALPPTSGIDVYMFRSIEKKQRKYNHTEFKEKLKVTNSRKKFNEVKGYFRT